MQNTRGPIKIRVWVNETERARRFRKVMTAVVDVKGERLYYEFYENELGKRKINVNASVQAKSKVCETNNNFWPITQEWKNSMIETEQLKTIIDKKIAETKH